MTHSHPEFEQGADKETVDSLRPIPTPNSEQLELLTQLRLRAMRRSYIHEMAVRDAIREMRHLERLADTSEYSGAILLHRMDGIMAVLFDQMIALRREERADAAFEEELWRQVTE
ncbi:hypothetical protein N7465_001187 [Penicillium sp. CMV-2018d]|nr:hypothetical protein N7465_001187 [Penicillium sp. CMV-2018d]